MAVLSREQILKADDLKRELVAVPDWGGEVYVRALCGTERDAFEASLVVMKGTGKNRKAERDTKDFTAKLCALTICDEAGKRLFGPADVVALGRKSSANLALVVEVAMRLNGLTDEGVEEAEKNSDCALNGASTSFSPEPSSDAP